MQAPEFPPDESARLACLRALHLLDTDAEVGFDRVTRLARRWFECDIALVSLVDADRQWFKSRQGLEAESTSREISFCGHAILQDGVFVVNDAQQDIRFHDNPLVTGAPNIRFYAGRPLRGPGGYAIGTLCVIDSAPRQVDRADIATLNDLAELIEAELESVATAATDPLTGIANRRGFYAVANHMLALCQRTGVPAELAFFDLDGLKQVNDTLGHHAGDALLRHFADLLQVCFRSADVVGRLGGDEFVVLMANSNPRSDAAFERLARLADRRDCAIRRTLAWSVGRVVFDPAQHLDIDALVQDADAVMYAQKLQKGANRTVESANVPSLT